MRRNFFNPSSFQSQDAATTPRERIIVGNDKRGELMLSMQPGDQVKNCVCGSLIEIAGWLVCQQELWTGNKCPCQSDPLLLPSGEFACPVMSSGCQPNLTQPFGGAPHCRLRVFTPGEQRHGHILQRVKLRQQIMKLPNKADFTVTKLRSRLFRKFLQ